MCGLDEALNLWEMAFRKKEAIEKIGVYADAYAEHLLKISIYQNSTNNLRHWIDELADKLSKVNDVKLKQGGKLYPQIYKDEFLLADGDCRRDFEIDLDHFKYNNSKTGKYPDFEITDDLISKTSDNFLDLAEYFSSVLSRENSYNKKWFIDKLSEYFE